MKWRNATIVQVPAERPPARVERQRAPEPESAPARRERGIELSPREEVALKAYVSGKTVDAVAREMRLRVSTVRAYLNRARDKYRQAGRKADTRVDLYERAVEDGLIPAPQSLDTTVVAGVRIAHDLDDDDLSLWLPEGATNALYRYVAARTQSWALPGMSAEDLLQETLVTYLTYRRSVGGEIPAGQVMRLLVQIARQKLDELARAARRRPAEVLVDELPEPSASSQAERLEPMTRAVDRLLEQLPEQQQDVLVLRIASGLSAKETGDALGISASAVRVMQHRALTRLRQKMAAAGLVPTLSLQPETEPREDPHQ